MSRVRSLAKASGVDLRFVRQGGNHEIWALGGERLVIPRHREINERTADGIIAETRRIVGR